MKVVIMIGINLNLVGMMIPIQIKMKVGDKQGVGILSQRVK